MKFCFRILALATIAATAYSVIGCSAPAGFSYQNVAISLTASCSDCPQGVTFNPAYPVPANANNGGQNASTIPVGAVVTAPVGGTGQEGAVVSFYASVSNAPATNVTWTIYPTPNLADIDTLPTGTAPAGDANGPGEQGSAVGQVQVASGSSVYYSTPSGIPIYTGAALEQANAMGIPQGDILLVASVPDSPSNPSSVATLGQLIETYGKSTTVGPPVSYLTPSTPTTPSGQTQPVVTVTHATSYAFYGGVAGVAPCFNAAACGTSPIGTVNDTAVWAVGPASESLSTAVVGGAVTVGGVTTYPYGSITQAGVYTAPATIPPTCSSTVTTNCTSIANEVVVYVWSQAAPTVASYAYVGIN